MFSFRSFIVSGLTFRSLIHFEFVLFCFVFWYGVRKYSSFILLQVVGQFPQHHLLKRSSFFPLYIIASFVKDKVSIGVWIYLWAFHQPKNASSHTLSLLAPTCTSCWGLCFQGLFFPRGDYNWTGTVRQTLHQACSWGLFHLLWAIVCGQGKEEERISLSQ